jgi:hypothetical protein
MQNRREMSLRAAGFAAKQSPLAQGDCFGRAIACPEYSEGYPLSTTALAMAENLHICYGQLPFEHAIARGVGLPASGELALLLPR